jgi:hypothetical protein
MAAAHGRAAVHGRAALQSRAAAQGQLHAGGGAGAASARWSKSSIGAVRVASSKVSINPSWAKWPASPFASF